MLEHSFYKRLRTINDRKFDVDDSKLTAYINQLIAKVNDQDIGLCYIKRLDDTSLILTVAPSFEREQYYSTANSTEDGFEPLSRLRANTWHHTKRADGLLCPQSLDSSKHYIRTLSVGSKPLTTTDMSWDQLKTEHELGSPNAKLHPSQSLYESPNNLQDFPANVFVEVYVCQKNDIENVLMFDSYTIGQSNNITKNTENKSSSTTIKSDKFEENLLISSQTNMVCEESGNKTYFKF